MFCKWRERFLFAYKTKQIELKQSQMRFCSGRNAFRLHQLTSKLLLSADLMKERYVDSCLLTEPYQDFLENDIL